MQDSIGFREPSDKEGSIELECKSLLSSSNVKCLGVGIIQLIGKQFRFLCTLQPIITILLTILCKVAIPSSRVISTSNQLTTLTHCETRNQIKHCSSTDYFVMIAPQRGLCSFSVPPLQVAHRHIGLN